MLHTLVTNDHSTPSSTDFNDYADVCGEGVNSGFFYALCSSLGRPLTVKVCTLKQTPDGETFKRYSHNMEPFRPSIISNKTHFSNFLRHFPSGIIGAKIVQKKQLEFNSGCENFRSFFSPSFQDYSQDKKRQLPYN